MFFDLGSLQKFHKYWIFSGEMERVSPSEDVKFKNADSWLQDAAVIDIVLKRNGQYLVGLVFAKPDEGAEFIIRYIRTCPTLKSAETTANFMRRLAAKDPRGTVTIAEDTYLLYDN